MQLLCWDRALELERGFDGIGEEKVEGAGEGGGDNEGFVHWGLGVLEGGDSGRRRKCGLRGFITTTTMHETHKKIKAKSTQNPQNLNPKGKPIPKSIPKSKPIPNSNPKTH